jgi:hypothetical protein
MSGASRVKYYKNAQIWHLTSCDYPHMEQSLFASNFPGAANNPRTEVEHLYLADNISSSDIHVTHVQGARINHTIFIWEQSQALA